MEKPNPGKNLESSSKTIIKKMKGNSGVQWRDFIGEKLSQSGI